MTRFWFKFMLLVAGAGVGGIGMPGHAAAQMIVHDPINLVELQFQYAQEVEQVSYLTSQLAQLEAMVRPLNTNILGPVTGLAQQTEALSAQLNSIAMSASELQNQLTTNYPTDFSSQSLGQTIALLNNEEILDRKAFITAQQVQDQVAANQPSIRQNIASGVISSQSAPGPTAAIQATNQILAGLSQQMEDQQSLILADERAKQNQEMKEESEEAAADQFNGKIYTMPAPNTW